MFERRKAALASDGGELIQQVSAECRLTMQIAFRAAETRDFEYCARLYFAGMEEAIRALNLHRDAQMAGLRKQWQADQARMITFDGADVGWLQSFTRDGSLFLAQLFVDAPFRRQGIGTEVMRRLIGEASDAQRPVTLGVVKANPALRLYQRLGFHITHEDDRKYYMKREVDTRTATMADMAGSLKPD